MSRYYFVTPAALPVYFQSSSPDHSGAVIRGVDGIGMMAAANLEQVKKKYNFKDIKVATWRDPALSIHPARGGLSTLSPFADTSYVPKFKDAYDSTDEEETETQFDFEDEDSESEGRFSSIGGTFVVGCLRLVDVIDPALEESFEGPSQTEAPIEEAPFEVPVVDDPGSTGTKGQVDEGIEIDDWLVDDWPPIDRDQPAEMASEVDEVILAGSATSAANEPVHTSSDEPLDEGNVMAVEVLEEGGEADQATPSEAGSESRRVSFSPDTTDPKPTARKKKTAKSTKGKKKRIAVPLDSLPANVIAMVDDAADRPPSPLTEDVAIIEEATPEASTTDEKPSQFIPDIFPEGTGEVADAQASGSHTTQINFTEDVAPSDVGEESRSEPALKDPESDVVVLEITQPVVPEEAIATNPMSPQDQAAGDPQRSLNAPKKSSKSGKDKDKLKKKSSKPKSRDVMPLPPPSGLGIDVEPLTDGSHGIIECGLPQQLKEGEGTTTLQLEIEPTEGEVEAAPIVEGNEAKNDGETSPKDNPNTEADTDLETPAEIVTRDENTGDSTEGKGVSPEDVAHDQHIENKDDLADAWDQDDVARDALELNIHKDELHIDTNDAQAEAATSPADSGVEFDPTESTHDVKVNGAGLQAIAAQEDTEMSASDKPIKSTTAEEDDLVEQADEINHSQNTLEFDADQKPTPADAPNADAEAQPAPEEIPNKEVSIEAETQGTKVSSEGEEIESPMAGVAELTGTEPLEKDDSRETVESGSHETDNGEAVVQAGDAALQTMEGPADDIAEADEATSLELSKSAAAKEYAKNDSSQDIPAVETMVEAPAAEEAQADPFQFQEVDNGQDDKLTGGNLEGVPEAAEPSPKAPPPPMPSKRSSHGSHKHKAARWQRNHKDSALKEALKDTKVLERTHASTDNGEDELRVAHRKRRTRRLSSSGADNEEHRRRRAERKLEETVRSLEVEKKKIAEDAHGREEQRAARKAEAPAMVGRNVARERETDAAQQRRSERSSNKITYSNNDRGLKASLPNFTLPGISKALNLAGGESIHGTATIRSHGGAYRPAKEASTSRTSSSKDRVQANGEQKESDSKTPPSSGGEKFQRHHRHHRHRSDEARSDRSERTHKDRGHHHSNRRPSIEGGVERPRSFLGLIRT